MKKTIILFLALTMSVASAIAQCATPTSAEATVTFKRKTPGSLSGGFSVSASKIVQFSQGNLQYTRESTSVAWSTGKFSFMTNQYDIVETVANPYCTTDYGDKTAVSLFGWATSGWNNGNRTAYYPNATINTNSYYGVKNPKAADETLTGDYANGDWGVYNSEDLGAEGWRTLTHDEWIWLIGYQKDPGSTCRRTDATIRSQTNCRFTQATINLDAYNSVKGVIIFPDHYTGPTSNTSDITWGGINNYNYTWATTCSLDGWYALEAAGCVFLPAAGVRESNEGKQVKEQQYVAYWASDAGASSTAYMLWMASNNVVVISMNRSLGVCVRLVRDVE